MHDGLDPQARRFLAMVGLARANTGEAAHVAERRASLERLMRFCLPPATPVAVDDFQARGCGTTVPLRVYLPEGAETPGPALLFFHGGGLVAGSLDTHDALCRMLAANSGCRVVAAGYRLAPEHPFPAAILDALAAARWVLRHAPELGVQRTALAVGGESGGATLATIAAQVMRGRFRAQVLLCPVLDHAGTTASRAAFGDGFLLDAATMAADLRWYAPQRPLADPRVSPLRAPDLTGMPVTILHTAGFDPLRDEGAAYAARLAAAGTAVRHTCHDGLIHGFYALTGAIAAAEPALARIGDEIAAVLA